MHQSIKFRNSDPGLSPGLSGAVAVFVLVLGLETAFRKESCRPEVNGIPVLFVEDVETEVRSVWWCVQVQRYGNVCFRRVRNLVKADLVVDVGHFVLTVDRLLDHSRTSACLGGSLIEGFFQGTLEYLHDTVGIGVIVDWTPFSWIPD